MGQSDVAISVEMVRPNDWGKDDIDPIISLLGLVGNSSQLYTALERLISCFCFDNFFFLATWPSLTQPTTVISSNLPKQWCELYEKSNYIGIDPTAVHCRTRGVPVLWWTEKCMEAACRNSATLAFIEAARNQGLRSGVSFAMHGAGGAWGMLNLSCNEELQSSRPRLDRSMPYNQLLSVYVFEAAARTIQPEPGTSECSLTEREMECLFWCSEGKTSWETSKILNISERTVFFHIQNAQHKLGAVNRIQAVRMAMPHIGWAVTRHSSARRIIRMCANEDHSEQMAKTL